MKEGGLNPFPTCHSLQSSCPAKRKRVTELYSCQNCGGEKKKRTYSLWLVQRRLMCTFPQRSHGRACAISRITTADLRDQKRETAGEMLNLSTSRTGIPLKRPKAPTVSSRPIDQRGLSHILMRTRDGFRWLDGIPANTAESSPTVRSSWFLSPRARSLYKQPLW